MLNKSTELVYAIGLLTSTGRKNFSNIARNLDQSDDSVRRSLKPMEETDFISESICKKMFINAKSLNIIIDDTLLNKKHSTNMQGTDKFFDSATNTQVTSYKILTCAISDGKQTFPLWFEFLYTKELGEEAKINFKTKDDLSKEFVEKAIDLFPDKVITILADGLFTTRSFVEWCFYKKINIEFRIASNRVIIYKGKKIALKDILKLEYMRPKNNKNGRTFAAIWYEMLLYFTIERRIDKKGEETFVFLVSTYKAEPRVHIKKYKQRWVIEKFFRVAKQELGLNDCQSMYLSTQKKHIASVFLSFAIAQLEMKKAKLQTTEEAIRRLKCKKTKISNAQMPLYIRSLIEFI